MSDDDIPGVAEIKQRFDTLRAVFGIDRAHESDQKRDRERDRTELDVGREIVTKSHPDFVHACHMVGFRCVDDSEPEDLVEALPELSFVHNLTQRRATDAFRDSVGYLAGMFDFDMDHVWLRLSAYVEKDRLVRLRMYQRQSQPTDWNPTPMAKYGLVDATRAGIVVDLERSAQHFASWMNACDYMQPAECKSKRPRAVFVRECIEPLRATAEPYDSNSHSGEKRLMQCIRAEAGVPDCAIQ